MRPSIEELDRHDTAIGELSLRRRWEPALEVDVFEVRVGEEFLMSSLFTVAEVALVDLALRELHGQQLDVVVGGLGLGCTARAVLDDDRVRSLRVIELSDHVIDWHRRGLVPLGAGLAADERCQLIEGDFFGLVRGGWPFGRVHAVLADIDHSPRQLLDPGHAGFYTVDGLRQLASRLVPGGVFALWSDDPPDPELLDTMRQVFVRVEGHVVPFANPYTGGTSANTVYVALAPDP